MESFSAVLPEAWGRMVDVFLCTSGYLTSINIIFPHLPGGMEALGICLVQNFTMGDLEQSSESPGPSLAFHSFSLRQMRDVSLHTAWSWVGGTTGDLSLLSSVCVVLLG